MATYELKRSEVRDGIVAVLKGSALYHSQAFQSDDSEL